MVSSDGGRGQSFSSNATGICQPNQSSVASITEAADGERERGGEEEMEVSDLISRAAAKGGEEESLRPRRREKNAPDRSKEEDRGGGVAMSSN
jgi:hypothetical protein